jgi:hypothetical protein
MAGPTPAPGLSQGQAPAPTDITDVNGSVAPVGTKNANASVKPTKPDLCKVSKGLGEENVRKNFDTKVKGYIGDYNAAHTKLRRNIFRINEIDVLIRTDAKLEKELNPERKRLNTINETFQRKEADARGAIEKIAETELARRVKASCGASQVSFLISEMINEVSDRNSDSRGEVAVSPRNEV